MIEASLVAWLWAFIAELVASAAGVTVMRTVKWSPEAQRANVPFAAGLALAPLLLGFATLLALAILPRASHIVHAIVVFAILLPIAAFVRRAPTTTGAPHQQQRRSFTWRVLLVFLLSLCVVSIVAEGVLMPLTQNDSLEYATVGRILYEQRTLTAYPVLSPEANSAGFFGPWTHPPLYVALIYLANILQGSAEVPGLMRGIAPWCALLSAYLVYTLGLTISRTAALGAALAFLSAPMYLLGAGSALIDALPVLGTALVFATAALVDGPPLRRALLQGAILGAALWTHSEAILLIPLGLTAIGVALGWRNRQSLRSAGISLAMALTLGIWPYLRNYAHFGSLISDNPAVFDLKDLGWPEYFRMSRGYSEWPEIIQYGVFKGWFMPEAYGLAFWLMTLGGVLFSWQQFRLGGLKQLVLGGRAGFPNRLFLVALSMLACYYGGVVLSVLLGIDLMIRNERYLLLVLPLVAFLAGYAIDWLVQLIEARLREARKEAMRARGYLEVAAGACFAAFLLLQAVSLVIYRFGSGLFQPVRELRASSESVGAAQKYLSSRNVAVRHVGTGAIAFSSEEQSRRPELRMSIVVDSERRYFGLDVKRDWPALNAVEFLRRETQKNALILSLRPADMYYSDRRMISYLDPRLLPFYREKDLQSAWRMLRDLGISYLHIPDYSLPSIYNSALQDLLASPLYTELVATFDGNQVYALNAEKPAEAAVEEPTVDFTPGKEPWTRIEQFVAGGRKNLGALSVSTELIMEGRVSSITFSLPVFRRDWSSMLISGIGGPADSMQPIANVQVNGRTEYLLDLGLEGHAYVRVWLIEFDAAGRMLFEGLRHSDFVRRFGEIAVGSQYPNRAFRRRFVTHPEAKWLRVAVEHRGASTLEITHARLSKVKEKELL